MLIHEQLLKVQSEIDAIGKNRRNNSQGFNFRGIDDVYNAIHGLFVENKILCRSEVLREHYAELPKSGDKYTFNRSYVIRYYFVAEDGSEYATDVCAEGSDPGDKASNKAMSAGHKYAILQAFTIPTEDMPDSDTDDGEREKLLKEYRELLAAQDWPKERKEAMWRGVDKQSDEFIKAQIGKLK